MIEGFESITAPLTEYERETLLPVMVKCLERHVGKENAITNVEMRSKLTEAGYKVNDVSIRKIINVIRNEGLVKCLIATKNGYYVSTNPEELKSYVRSLLQRSSAIFSTMYSICSQICNIF